ncbi:MULTISPECIES: ATP-binding protein [Fusobacterium]|uniref:ATP-binding protein n=1 Tax=Fusobacterium TaxID=848 RepID=UPI001476BEA5|nr:MULTISPECIES: ATP-binding protein [Fusobacterium]NME35475.1 ATP-binding protein [Fusobacterium sp. FSA-380-WT-3A]
MEENSNSKKNEIRISISSTLENLSVIRALIRTYLNSYKIDERTIMEILTITDELATNVVEHGYQYKPGELIICIEKDKDLIKLVVEDNGVGFDDSKMSKEEGGMGLMIAKKMSDNFKIEKKINGTKFKVEKRLKEEK